MRQHVLYIGCHSQIQIAESALRRLKGRELVKNQDFVRYELTHRVLEDMILEITMIKEIDQVTSHIRNNAIDLLIYDERGPDGVEALAAIDSIKKDVKALGELWGPDFLFPMSRVVAVLNTKSSREDRHRVFMLGKKNVRDVAIAPKATIHLLVWLKEVLWHGVKRENKLGIALSGGGLEGFLYQLGAIHALESCVSKEGRSLKRADIISGVSSGALAGALFASDVPSIEVIRSFKGTSKILPKFTSRTIFDVAGADIMKRVIKNSATWTGLDVKAFMNNTMRSIPTGFFKGDSLESYFKTAIEASGSEDHFPREKPHLFVGATDQDTMEHVTFDAEAYPGMSLSEAMRASSALPPVFSPKQIEGRYYIDGQVTKTVNLDLCIEKGCRLVLVINPLKPYKETLPGSVDKEGGVYSLIQTIKALVQTRFERVLNHCLDNNPDTDFIVFEPDEECAHLMSGSPMRYNIRTKVISLAFRDTCRKLQDRYQVYSVKLARFGIQLIPREEIPRIEEEYFREFEE